MKENYLLTGATGLIGSALLRKLVAEGNSVTCPIRNKEKAKGLFDGDIYNKVQWIEMQTNLEKAKQQEISTRKSLDDCHLTSPIRSTDRTGRW